MRDHLEELVARLRRWSAPRCTGGRTDGAPPHDHAVAAAGSVAAALPPRLAADGAPPQPHASWTRRQNSIMWSPLPQRYAFSDEEQLHDRRLCLWRLVRTGERVRSERGA